MSTDVDAWFTLLYGELHRLARGELFRRHALNELTLGPTTVLHEAWLRMGPRELAFDSQAQLVSYAARVMRTIVVDHLRERQSLKRGHGYELAPFQTLIELQAMPVTEVLRVDEAIAGLSQVDAMLAELVELKFFAGLSVSEIATLRGVSDRKVERDWDKARALLFQVLSG